MCFGGKFLHGVLNLVANKLTRLGCLTEVVIERGCCSSLCTFIPVPIFSWSKVATLLKVSPFSGRLQLIPILFLPAAQLSLIFLSFTLSLPLPLSLSLSGVLVIESPLAIGVSRPLTVEPAALAILILAAPPCQLVIFALPSGPIKLFLKPLLLFAFFILPPCAIGLFLSPPLLISSSGCLRCFSTRLLLCCSMRRCCSCSPTAVRFLWDWLTSNMDIEILSLCIIPRLEESRLKAWYELGISCPPFLHCRMQVHPGTHPLLCLQVNHLRGETAGLI
mmetsp:Transcript_15993/g.37706  ORF Transcript_15993/g.37706 Transcript_15993/m.37706 type:complete len:277 (-) Transcript_15993:440-1270(-)